MKKCLWVIAGLMLFAVAVEADCGSCDAAKPSACEAKMDKQAACAVKAECKAEAPVCDVKGTCKAEAAKEKASGKMKAANEKAACKMEGAENKAACEMKNAQDKAAGKMKAAKPCGSNCKKPCCAAKEVEDNASEKAQKQRKKWWKFGFGK